MLRRAVVWGAHRPCFIGVGPFPLQGQEKRPAGDTDAHYYQLIKIATCKRNFSQLTALQQELISIAELYCFKYRVTQQSIRPGALYNIFPPLHGRQASRLDGQCDVDLFKTGIYAKQDLAPGDFIEYHLDRGGDSSLFRGDTKSQNATIMGQKEPRVHYYAISTFGVSVLGLGQAFVDYPTLCERLLGRSQIKLFFEEAETIIPRPIPPQNIEEIIETDNRPHSYKNTAFHTSGVKKYSLSWRELFLRLQEHKCLNEGKND